MPPPDESALHVATRRFGATYGEAFPRRNCIRAARDVQPMPRRERLRAPTIGSNGTLARS